jgi:hypothetical protein
MIDVCIPKEKMLASNYDDFIKCSKSLTETSQVVAQLIGAIRNNDTAQIIKFIGTIKKLYIFRTLTVLWKCQMYSKLMENGI